LGYGWRASYVLAGAPGVLVAILLFFVQVQIIVMLAATFGELILYSGM
jgi:hypothetical protein